MAAKASNSRKRGVRASRAKLYRALADGDLRSQAELAARIADLEQLENEPLSLVNRVFREQPVEAASLERVARALGVEAWTLYLEAQVEADPISSAESSPEPVIARPRSRRRFAVLAGVAIVAMLVFVFLQQASTPDSPAVPLPGVEPALGRPTVAVLGFQDDTGLELAAALRQRLEAEFSVVMGSMEMLSEQYGEREAAERLRAQWLVDGEHLRHGRWSGIRIWLQHNDHRVPVWSGSSPTAQLQRDHSIVVDESFAAIRDHILGRPPHETTANPDALEDYLVGRMHLDRAITELNVRRAQSGFEAAIRRDPDFARAHAGLCLALLEEIWIQNEQWALEQAGTACREAQALAPADPVVELAQSALLRRNGQIDGAIEMLARAAATTPGEPDLLNMMATLQFHRYRQTGEAAALAAGRAAAIASAEADPAFWKPLFTLAIIEYFNNDIDAAVAASQAALEREENASILTNLGTFELCAGKIEQARSRYLRVRELEPQAHAGDEFLGLVHYYLGEYENSRQLRQRAIESLPDGSPEIHQMWGGLAESRWRAGDPDGALQAWLQAIEIVERDRLRGTAGHDDDAARIHYHAAITKLRPPAMSNQKADELARELAELANAELSASGWLSVAKAWLKLEQASRATAALDQAAATCPGYARLPDFLELSSPTVAETS